MSPAAWIESACTLAGRPLTEEEWERFAGAIPDRPHVDDPEPGAPMAFGGH